MAIRLRSTAMGHLPSGAPELGAGGELYRRPGGTGLSGSRSMRARQPIARSVHSMADTCARPSRWLIAGGAGSEHVRQAYGRLKAMGL
jgi:hypothetical protein